MKAPRLRLFIVSMLVASLTFGIATASGADDAVLKRARKFLSRYPIVDGHNDLPIAIRQYAKAPSDLVAYDLRARTAGETDIERLRLGGVGAQFWSVYISGEAGSGYARTQLEQIELTRRMIARYPEAFSLSLTAVDARRAMRRGRIASFMGMEGGYALENSLGALRAYYDLGVRYMTLTHNTHTDWADSAAQVPARHDGLTEFGEAVVGEMNRLGMLVDLAHVADATALDALRVTQAPVIFSHAAARALCDLPRNVPDNVLAQLPRNRGVFMVTFVAGFVDCEVARVTQPLLTQIGFKLRQARSDAERRAVFAEMLAIKPPPTSIAKVVDHIEHVKKIVGIEHVGIGGDFNGNPWWPAGLSDVSMYPNLIAELMRRGWNERELRKLVADNALRALAEAESVAAHLQRTTPASTVRFTPPAPAATSGQ
jgi:membrane dipeptidase